MAASKKKNKKIACTIGLAWVSLLLIFGLLQLWLDLGWDYYKEPSKFNFFPAISQGALLFFCLAATSAVSIDFHFEPKLASKYSGWKTVCFVAVPTLILIVTISAYFITIKAHSERVQLTTIKAIQSNQLQLSSIVVGDFDKSNSSKKLQSTEMDAGVQEHADFVLHSNLALLMITLLYAFGCKTYMFYSR